VPGILRLNDTLADVIVKSFERLYYFRKKSWTQGVVAVYMCTGWESILVLFSSQLGITTLLTKSNFYLEVIKGVIRIGYVQETIRFSASFNGCEQVLT
jgi:hypothetical protein